MIKKAMIAMVVIVAAAAITFAAAGSAGHTNHEKQQNLSAAGNASNSNLSKGNVSNVSNSTHGKKKISSAEAQKIAQKYIEEPGATAGKPLLSKTGGKYVYTVPVMQNKKNVGEIDIDATSGKNVGGAGGAP